MPQEGVEEAVETTDGRCSSRPEASAARPVPAEHSATPALSWPGLRAPRGRGWGGTSGCNRSFGLQLPARPRLAVWAPDGITQGRSHPEQPSSQPVCRRPSRSQQSQWSAGWGRRQEWPGSQPRPDLLAQITCCLPAIPNNMPNLEERGVTSHPKAALTQREGGAPAKGEEQQGSSCRVLAPLIEQTARPRSSLGSSFEGRCQDGALGVPQQRDWRGWATDQPLWPVLPGTCQTLEKQEAGWARGLGWGTWAGGQGQASYLHW